MQQFSYQNSDQSAATSVLEKILSQKCKLHRQFVCEFLHMKPSDSSPRLCIKCMEVRNIQANEYISIRLLLEASITTTFNAYPKFNDNSITQQIQQYRDTSDKVQEELSSFFENLQSTILLTIEKLKIAQKEKLASLQASYQSIYDTLAQISQVEKLKTLIKNENEEELKYFINQQFSSADTYTQKINNNLNEYKKIYEGFSLNEPMNQLNQIVKLIERIQFFPTILQNIANNSQQQSHFSYQPQQQRDQLLLQQQQQQLQHELQLKQMQQQQQQQEQQYEQQQQLQHQKQQLQKQQKQQQQQQLIEQQRSTSSQSVYAEYQSLVKQGVEKKILWSESSSKLEWWWESSWESSKKEWWSSSKELLLKKSYARTYEEWQAFSENERQEQLNILRKYVHLSN